MTLGTHIDGSIIAGAAAALEVAMQTEYPDVLMEKYLSVRNIRKNRF